MNIEVKTARHAKLLVFITILFAAGAVLAVYTDNTHRYYNLFSLGSGLSQTLTGCALGLILPFVIFVTGLFGINRLTAPLGVLLGGCYLMYCALDTVAGGAALTPELLPKIFSSVQFVVMTVACAFMSLYDSFPVISFRGRGINRKLLTRRILMFILLAIITSGVVLLSSLACGLTV